MFDCAIASGRPVPDGRLISRIAGETADGPPAAFGPALTPVACGDLLELLAGVTDGRPGQGAGSSGGGRARAGSRGGGCRVPVVHRDRRVGRRRARRGDAGAVPAVRGDTARRPGRRRRRRSGGWSPELAWPLWIR